MFFVQYLFFRHALEQVQIAGEQFGRSETKHFLYMALFWFSVFRWDTFSVFEKIQFKNIWRGALEKKTERIEVYSFQYKELVKSNNLSVSPPEDK